MILQWYDETFEYPYIVQYDTYINFYNENKELVNQIVNISPEAWRYISLQNTENWTSVSEIPTENEKIRADVDYSLMCIEEIMEFTNSLKTGSPFPGSEESS